MNSFANNQGLVFQTSTWKRSLFSCRVCRRFPDLIRQGTTAGLCRVPAAPAPRCHATCRGQAVAVRTSPLPELPHRCGHTRGEENTGSWHGGLGGGAPITSHSPQVSEGLDVNPSWKSAVHRPVRFSWKYGERPIQLRSITQADLSLPVIKTWDKWLGSPSRECPH